MSESKQCPFCLHYLGTAPDNPDVATCLAFPEGIPEAIMVGDLDHTKPVEGDNGIRFEPVAPTLAGDDDQEGE